MDDNLKKAQAYLDGGNIIEALNSYYAAAISSTKVKDRVDEFPIYVNKMNRILGSLFLEANDNPDSIDTKKGGRFGFTLNYSSDQGKIPVSGAKIAFLVRDNDGAYQKDNVTVSNGGVSCLISSLKEVNSSTRIYGRLSYDFPEILDAGGAFKIHYDTLKDSVAKISAYSEFRTVSSVNRAIPTAVVAMISKDSGYKIIQNMTSEAQSALIKKGYKVVKFSESVPLGDIYEAKQSALSKLEDKGIKRVFVLAVNSEDKPAFNETLGRYMGVYSVSAQLIDTATGEIISAKNIKITATSTSAETVFDSFVKAAGRQIKDLID